MAVKDARMSRRYVYRDCLQNVSFVLNLLYFISKNVELIVCLLSSYSALWKKANQVLIIFNGFSIILI